MKRREKGSYPTLLPQKVIRCQRNTFRCLGLRKDREQNTFRGTGLRKDGEQNTFRGTGLRKDREQNTFRGTGLLLEVVGWF